MLTRSRTETGAAALAALRADPTGSLIALDYDGTLAPIVERPEDARPAPGVVAALERCAKVFRAVAIITGRPAFGPVALAGLGHVDGLTVIGHYGAERWTREHGLVRPRPHPGLAEARARLAEALVRAPAGTLVEDKGLSVAVHTRPCADPESALDAVIPLVSEIAVATGLALEHGRLVVEMRPPGAVTKDTALNELIAEFEPRAVLFAGDDVVDLAAYDAVEELCAAGGVGVTVFVENPEAPPHMRERADVVLPDVAAMVRLLEELADGR